MRLDVRFGSKADIAAVGGRAGQISRQSSHREGGPQWGRNRSTEPVEDVGQAQVQRAYTWKYRE
jgi:hypothetical protein